MTRKYRTALYPGSFNPFTTGHASIVKRALSLCDKLIIGVGRNRAKKDDDAEVNARVIGELYGGDERVEVAVYDGLTVDFAKDRGVDFMIRGVRNVSDFEYERTLAEANLKISGIETLLMPALPELGYVSSSLVRELEAFGHDASEFLPSSIELP